MSSSQFGLGRVTAQVALCAALAGCQTYDESVRQSLQGYIGQPVQRFAEDKSLMPSGVYEDAGVKTYIFNRARCGYTIKATGSPGGVAIIREISSTCPPG